MPIKTADQIEEMLSVEDFMSRFGVKSRSTVYRWIRERFIKTAKVGRRRLIPVSEAHRVIQQSTRYGL